SLSLFHSCILKMDGKESSSVVSRQQHLVYQGDMMQEVGDPYSACMCVCVCVWYRERARDRCLCVFSCILVCLDLSLPLFALFSVNLSIYLAHTFSCFIRLPEVLCPPLSRSLVLLIHFLS